jgi:Uma2 family endonuclease
MSVVDARAETRIVIPNIAWEVFEALAASDCPGTRFAYDKGLLEIMSPSIEHELLHRLLGRMVETLTEELNIAVLSGGATTLKLEMKKRGLEPDECYYLANESRMRGKRDLDLTVDPPPDLAIEVDLSRTSMNKMGIYADIGVPELWFFDGEALSVYCLQGEAGYVPRETSATFPFLDLKEITRFIGRFESLGETAWIRSFRAWVREQYGHLTDVAT